jgi:hypothetical protein
VDRLLEIRDDRILEFAVFLAVVLGIVVTGFFIYFGQEPYSAIYINSSSIVHDSSQNNVFFIYGVKSAERSETRYTLDIYSGDVLIKNTEFSIKPGETFEEGIRLELPPDTTLPYKISLNLNTGTHIEEVHFWIRQ